MYNSIIIIQTNIMKSSKLSKLKMREARLWPVQINRDKDKNSYLKGKSAGEFSQIPPSFLICGEGGIRTRGPV